MRGFFSGSYFFIPRLPSPATPGSGTSLFPRDAKIGSVLVDIEETALPSTEQVAASRRKRYERREHRGGSQLRGHA